MKKPTQFQDPNDEYANVFHMELLFIEAFANAFNLSLEQAAHPMWEVMDQLDDSGFTEKLAKDFPATVGDLERLEEYNRSRSSLHKMSQ